MQCSNCGSQMTQTTTGWQCPTCGHTELNNTPSASGPSVAPAAVPVPESEYTAKPPVASAHPLSPTPGSTVDAVGPSPQPSPSPTLGPISASSVMPGLPPAPPEGGGRSKKPVIIAAVIALIILIPAAIAFKLWWLDPRYAPVAYLQKLVSAKTGTFKASLDYTLPSSDSSLSVSGNDLKDITVTANGSYDLSDKSAVKSDLTLGVKAASTNTSAHIITFPTTAYFQLTKAGLLAFFGLQDSNTWYKVPITQSSNQNQCTSSKNPKSTSYYGFSLPTSIPVDKAYRVGWSATVAGHSTTRYTGMLNFNKLQTVVDQANKNLPSACKISFNKSDYKDVVVSYNLWTSKQFDRLSLTIENNDNPKSSGTITFDTSGYNQPVTITAPAGAQPFTEPNLLNDSTGTADPSASSRATTPAPIRTIQNRFTPTPTPATYETSAGGVKSGTLKGLFGFHGDN